MRVAQKAVIVRKGKILLLVKRSPVARAVFRGKWDLPGGGMREGETPAACLRREVREETGLRVVRVARPVWQWVFVTPKKGRKPFELFLTAWLCEAGGRIRVSNEHEGAEWVELRRVKSGAFPSWLKIVARSL